MATVKKFGTPKLLDPANRQFYGQERVNAEIFTAMELLGRKLERVEAERERLARRLAMIETVAELDERTGKLYLPTERDMLLLPRPSGGAASSWGTGFSFIGGLAAFFALGLALLRAPAPALTPEHLALLDRLKSLPPVVASYENKAAPVLAAASPAFLPEPVAAAAEDEAEIPAAPGTAALSQDEIAALPPAAEDKGETVVDVAAAAPPPDPSLPAQFRQIEARAYQGIPEAQHDLAALYVSGKPEGRDYARALHWFGRAADGGVANAFYNLGVMHQQGLGTSPDMAKAAGWYEQAAELGHPQALYNLGTAYIEGTGVQANIPRGVSLLKRAANAGVAQAAYNLGVLHESSFAGAMDASKAAEWYRQAAAKGHVEAGAAVSRLEKDQASTLSEKVEPAAGE